MTQQTNSLRLPEQNSVIMVGRLTRDPELRRTGTGKAVCSFDIAISRRFKDQATGEWKDADPTFVPIVVWGDMAERCGERLKKGAPVHVEGRLQTNKWESTDGTKKSRLEVIASRVQFLSIVRHESQTQAAAIGAKPVDDDSQPNTSFSGDEDEDIPF
ncbi:single-stranded DNA-binding protein [Endomicrobium proavitum]|uniref:Single-stranded DNA-binding protein n=1 Tax=Endomicrobium proavitum TaxID=1408281 RepID=A0A0G3WHL9_9BACT|nr:single-stranded DNA-binding protein [Endomicrobium proavitum]AKL97392.1 Single-stranded DNA-binding protein [Endomicrobium proavitum]